MRNPLPVKRPTSNMKYRVFPPNFLEVFMMLSPFFVDEYAVYGFQTFQKIVESRKDVFKKISKQLEFTAKALKINKYFC